MSKKCKVHFIGINGSGASAAALIAKKHGYIVTGCDTKEKGYYTSQLISENIEIFAGHNVSHVQNADVVAASPAVILTNNEEIALARKQGKLCTWQQFIGTYILKNKKVIAVAGTHGKSTTTALMSVVLKKNGFSPNALMGAIYQEWNGGYLYGDSDYFVIEADEYNRNFHNYTPSIAMIVNIEMDHPEYYTSYEEMLDAYVDFVLKLKDEKILILNVDSQGVRDLLMKLKDKNEMKEIRVITYSGVSKAEGEIQYTIIKPTIENTKYEVITGDMRSQFQLSVPGKHNVSNSIGVIIAARILNIEDEGIQKALSSYTGIGRRFDKRGKVGNMTIIDDYAHHPTEIKATLETCKMAGNNTKICVIFEPHQVARLSLLFDSFVEALNIADTVIITKTFLGREINKTAIARERWQEALKEKLIYEEDYEKIAAYINGKAKDTFDYVVVCGAANSYKISQRILDYAQHEPPCLS